MSTPSKNLPLEIRPARPGDEGSLLELIRELAEYEKLTGEVEATEALLAQALFGEPPGAHALLAHWEDAPSGFALYFFNFSTFVGRPGLYLEDLYVRESCRGRGIGKALLMTLARRADELGCGRMEWSVLDWNRPAIEFYERLGARPMSDWTVFRLDRPALERISRRGNAGLRRGTRSRLT